MDFLRLDYSPRLIVDRLLTADRRVLLFGPPGIGKSTLAVALARDLAGRERRCLCLGADPGSPAFGAPGAVCLGEWLDDSWALRDYEALCTLDAARFRLPLVSAVRELIGRAPPGMLLVDAPGVVRGAAGAELLLGIAEAAAIDVVLALERKEKPTSLINELRALDADVFLIDAAVEARRPGKRSRARERTDLWNIFLGETKDHSVDLAGVRLLGTPPPLDIPDAWAGRQIALMKGRRTGVIGEALGLEGSVLRARLPATVTAADADANALLVRDAQRDERGMLGTTKPFASGTLHFIPPPDVMPYSTPRDSGGLRPIVRAGAATATLVNGIFGDPLLHIRLHHEKRSLLFDLGEAGRLPARIAHQVTDVFISHAHIDHIGGFLWLLRSRMGEFPACRLYGPPGLAANIQGMLDGIHWDRIGDRGPSFEVGELHADRLLRYRLQAGSRDREPLEERLVESGVLIEEPGFVVRAATLDHGTPVLAFAFEPTMQINVRKEQLDQRGLVPGPWLSELKRHIAEDARDAVVGLPDGTERAAGELADDLVLISSGKKLAYATDLADTAENRARLAALARGAHTFFCEAPFVEADGDQAARTGHLTTRACGEIATAADVEHLVPFHFSKRYEEEPLRVYAEVRAACSRTVVPRL